MRTLCPVSRHVITGPGCVQTSAGLIGTSIERTRSILIHTIVLPYIRFTRTNTQGHTPGTFYCPSFIKGANQVWQNIERTDNLDKPPEPSQAINGVFQIRGLDGPFEATLEMTLYKLTVDPPIDLQASFNMSSSPTTPLTSYSIISGFSPISTASTLDSSVDFQASSPIATSPRTVSTYM